VKWQFLVGARVLFDGSTCGTKFTSQTIISNVSNKVRLKTKQ